MNKKNNSKKTFISKYKPYYLKDFYMNEQLFTAIKNF